MKQNWAYHEALGSSSDYRRRLFARVGCQFVMLCLSSHTAEEGHRIDRINARLICHCVSVLALSSMGSQASPRGGAEADFEALNNKQTYNK